VVHTEDYNNKSQLVLFAGDTSLVITSSNLHNFIRDIKGVFKDINLFEANLSLNFDNTSLTLVWAENSSHIPISVGCDNNVKSNISSMKFLEIMIDNTLM
jgi:hypothetical protein